ncbi:MAG: NAD-dependent epimerase/dehydratase family protein [Candidatus Melainabacteria bacterium]|nr:NAD-dependent epimerase/dehydratase family protein [Candidatus Melainabacteria bacterium]
MSVVISGICGFVGSSLARWLKESQPDLEIFGFDNFSRPGSHLNRAVLDGMGIKVFHADVRQASDVDNMPKAKWVIDAAANPSVLAGVDGISSSKQVIESNLYGSVNLLEYAKRHQAGFILISSSRVYSIAELQKIPLAPGAESYVFDEKQQSPQGVSANGIAESFSTAAPISLYGGTKLASEVLALEYAAMSNIPVWINRCGVLAGAGQFGRPDQGIFSYWIHSYLARQPLRYVGFGGSGLQVRDCLHPSDLSLLIKQQMDTANDGRPQICNIGGGKNSAMSLKQLSNWCSEKFAEHTVSTSSDTRMFDTPWIVMDNGLAKNTWKFEPKVSLNDILEEIAVHAKEHPEWLKVSAI